MRASRRLRSVGFGGMVVILVACNVQSGSFSTRTSPNYRPEAKNFGHDRLLYASATEESAVLLFSYPQGDLVGTLTGFAAPPQYICADRNGNVFVPTTDNSAPGYICEFPHGGSQPTETLTDPGPGHAFSCSVDPTTGNLAVANGPNVAVYPHGQGIPTIFETTDYGAEDCAYDASGNLFVDSISNESKIAELRDGRTRFSDIALSEPMIPGHLQWWHKRLVIEAPPTTAHGPYQMFQVRISGSKGIVSGPVLLLGNGKHRGTILVEFALAGKSLAMPNGPGYSLINLWHYPRGGEPYATLNSRPRDYNFYGLAISK